MMVRPIVAFVLAVAACWPAVVAAQPGDTWTFQAWFRDSIPGAEPSNTSSAVAVTLR